jgi:hypothetical protein
LQVALFAAGWSVRLDVDTSPRGQPEAFAENPIVGIGYLEPIDSPRSRRIAAKCA